MKVLLVLFFVLPLALTAAKVSAGVISDSAAPVEGKGLTREVSEGDELVKRHCTGCHTEGRIMTSLQAMHSDQDDSYEKQIKGIVLRKIRMTNGNISRQDGRKIMDYLVSIWRRQKPVATLSVPVFTGPAALRRQAAARNFASAS